MFKNSSKRFKIFFNFLWYMGIAIIKFDHVYKVIFFQSYTKNQNRFCKALKSNILHSISSRYR